MNLDVILQLTTDTRHLISNISGMGSCSKQRTGQNSQIKTNHSAHIAFLFNICNCPDVVALWPEYRLFITKILSQLAMCTS